MYDDWQSIEKKPNCRQNCLWKFQMIGQINKKLVRVSYIVPVFNTEKFIGRCVRSLMEQTYPYIDYIFVNNGSTDGSVAILREAITHYPNRQSRVKIIENSINRGSATARNQGLDVAEGDYVMFADSDDYVNTDYVESMVAEAERTNADIVYCDFFESYEDGDRLIKQDYGVDPMECACSMLSRAMHGSTCNKNFRRKFLLHVDLKFVDGADLFEDVGWNVRLMACKPKLAYISKAFYHYVKFNPHSIIQSMMDSAYSRSRCLQRIRNVDVACKYMEAKGLMNVERIRTSSRQWMLLAKNDLIGDNFYSLKRWIVTFPEADGEIWRCKKLTFNLRLLLMWLHLHLVCLYRFQKTITKII